jgi:hypothetical protein
MVHQSKERLFAPDKIEWMLAGGLESLEPAERQFLLVMAETKMQGGYRPDSAEKEVVQRLRDAAGDSYDPRDIRRKVRALVKSQPKDETLPLKLPPVFNRLISRLRSSASEPESDR